MINFYAKEEHFRDHLQPVYDKITDLGYPARWVLRGESAADDSRFAVVASSGDLNRATKEKKMVFYMEHGAGQSYNIRHSSYAGGPNREHVCMFLSPGPHVTQQNSLYHPFIPSAPVGVPKLDEFHANMRPEIESPQGLDDNNVLHPVVCISFHWNCNVCPETKNGFDHFKNSVLKLREYKDEFTVVGHCHPRARKEIKPFFESNGIRFIEDFNDVLKEADIYVCDNSSTIFEFASIGKPVVLLNPPHYRKHVKHGLRFWKYADIGPNAHNFQSLLLGIRKCVHDTKEDRDYRKKLINEIYYEVDGNAAERAANAILDHIEEIEKMEKQGNYIVVKRHSIGVFGLVEPGQRIIVFPTHAIINDKNGNFKRKKVFAESDDPAAIIRKVIKAAPASYELVETKIDLDVDDDDIKPDYSSSSRNKDKGFNAVDRDFTEQELYIIQQVQAGKGKTEITRNSGHLGDQYGRDDMMAAWNRLQSQEIIVKGEGNKLWEINIIGRN